MKHLTEEQIVLHCYADAPDVRMIEEHLEECAQCRGEFHKVKALLAEIPVVAPPEPPAYLEQKIWLKVRDQVPERRSSAWLPKWAMAAVMAVLVLAAFLAGRFWPRHTGVNQQPHSITGPVVQDSRNWIESYKTGQRGQRVSRKSEAIKIMVRTSFLIFFLSMGLASVAQTQIPASGFLDPQAAAQNANAREEEVYSSATDALNSGQYDNAIKGFTEAAKIHGRRADGALYWKAYALNKAARKQEALETVAELRKEYPQSRYLKEAGALEIEIHSAAGQKVDPENQPDEDLKLYALDSIMQSD